MKTKSLTMSTILIISSILITSFTFIKHKKEQTNLFTKVENFEGVNIGKQTWMAKNLEVTTFSNGETIEEALTAVKARDLSHKDKEGYGPAVYDQKSTSYTAIRGREQQLIDFHGKAQSEGGTSGNLIRGVGKNNKAGLIYHNSANSKFGELHKYTGNLPTTASTNVKN